MSTLDELIQSEPDSYGVLIAGPGTGKTYQMAQRVAELQRRSVALDDVLALSLTNETVKTLRGRMPEGVEARRPR